MTNERITPKQICEWAHWVPSPPGSGYHCAINWHMSTDPDVADYNVILTKMDQQIFVSGKEDARIIYPAMGRYPRGGG